MPETQAITKETLIEQVKAGIEVHEKRFHKVKIRIFKDALDFLDTFDAEQAYELLADKRDSEVGTNMNYATSEILDGYDDLSKIFKAHFKEIKRAAKAKSQS